MFEVRGLEVVVKSNLEFKTELEERTKVFAVGVFKLLDALPRKNSTRIVSYQLGRSASSIGANYHEANRAESRNDFVHKCCIALKEASETCYWLDVLSRLYPMHTAIETHHQEAIELRNILQAVTKTASRKATVP